MSSQFVIVTSVINQIQICNHYSVLKGIATHSSILSWKIPMDRGASWATQSMGSQRVGYS